jgi:hypothetical protein
MSALLLFAALSGHARAPAVPRREIPPQVLVELLDLEHRFDLALGQDCDAERCFSTGCTYLDHAVADQPRRASLPGLAEESGPGASTPQAYLTKAQCGFAHEAALEASDTQVLTRRLQSKMSGGWTVVSVSGTPLPELPDYLRDAPAPVVDEDAAEEAPPPPPAEPAWTAAVAGRELWSELLPHFFWMLGIGLVTVASGILIWAWRKVGRASLEEQALYAQLMEGGDLGTEPAEGESDAASVTPVEDEAERVEAQAAAWTERLAAVDPADPDPELQALVRALLRAGEIPLLAKAVLRFPDTFPAVFPRGGDVATQKLALADFLKTADLAELPSDADFFAALDRHALAAALATQSDAEMVRNLREDFGSAGLAGLISQLPPRRGALLFALAPVEAQHEMVRLLPAAGLGPIVQALLASNRMDEDESAWLFAAVRAARGDGTMPAAPERETITDRGAQIDAAGALSLVLPHVPDGPRTEALGGALQRFGGTLPAWYRDILVPDMLSALPAEARGDLLLGVDVDALAAWRSVQRTEDRGIIDGYMPSSLRTSVAASSRFPSRSRQLALADQGRRAIARGLQGQLARAGVPFSQAFSPASPASPA